MLCTQSCMHPHTFPLLRREMELCGCTSGEAKAGHGQVCTSGLEPFLCALCCGDIQSARKGSWGSCGRAGLTTLQGHRRIPSSTVPSAPHYHCHAEGKFSCSLWHPCGSHSGRAAESDYLHVVTLVCYYYIYCVLYDSIKILQIHKSYTNMQDISIYCL